MQCGCKFIKSSEEFLQKNLAKLKENSSPQKSEFIEMKVKENLVDIENTKIVEEKNGNFLFF